MEVKGLVTLLCSQLFFIIFAGIINKLNNI